MIVYRQQKPRLGGHEKALDYAPKNNGKPGALGRRVIAHIQAKKDRERTERQEHIKTVMAERLREIQSAEDKRQRRGR